MEVDPEAAPVGAKGTSAGTRSSAADLVHPVFVAAGGGTAVTSSSSSALQEGASVGGEGRDPPDRPAAGVGLSLPRSPQGMEDQLSVIRLKMMEMPAHKLRKLCRDHGFSDKGDADTLVSRIVLGLVNPAAGDEMVHGTADAT
mmetsp:Transcript_34024/g.105739  ORF Transcript_34024/g.105739 Transcript_34024/m.105739 type:complete len:143 (+) Transcript_34024:365-793(+)